MSVSIVVGKLSGVWSYEPKLAGLAPNPWKTEGDLIVLAQVQRVCKWAVRMRECLDVNFSNRYRV